MLAKIFDSCAVDVQLTLALEAEEPHEPVATENGSDRGIAGLFKPALKLFVGAGRPGGGHASPRMAVKMRQQPVAKLLQLDEQPVRGADLAFHAHHGAALMRELELLIEHHDAVDLSPGDKEELFVMVSRQLLETFVQKQAADREARLLPRAHAADRGLDLVQGNPLSPRG